PGVENERLSVAPIAGQFTLTMRAKALQPPVRKVVVGYRTYLAAPRAGFQKHSRCSLTAKPRYGRNGSLDAIGPEGPCGPEPRQAHLRKAEGTDRITLDPDRPCETRSHVAENSRFRLIVRRRGGMNLSPVFIPHIRGDERHI